MFDTVAGLPVHPLAVHAVVVLLPVMSLVTIVVAVRPAWRRSAAWLVVVADFLVLGAAFVAKESGEKLQVRLSALRGGGAVAQTHAQQGELVPLFALALLGSSVVVWFVRRRAGGVAVAAIGLAIVAGAAAIGWTIQVGHSGATDTWSSIVTSSASGS